MHKRIGKIIYLFITTGAMGVGDQSNLDNLHGLDHCATLAAKLNGKIITLVARCLKLVELYFS